MKPNCVEVGEPLPCIHVFQLKETGLRARRAASDEDASKGATLSLRRRSDEDQLVAEPPLPMVHVVAEPMIVRLPFASSSKAETLEVAEAVEVAMKSRPPAFRKVQMLSPVEPSERPTCGLDEDV